MNRFLMTAALAASVLAATPAGAATIFYIPGQNYDEKVHNDHQNPGNPITLKTDVSEYLVDYTANAILSPNGNGFAKQDGPFSYVIIDPQTVGMSKIGFTLTPDGKNNLDYTFDILVSFVGGGPTQLLNGILPNNGKVDVWADGSEVIENVKIFNLKSGGDAFNFEDIRHTSFNAVESAIPEPATWAMMIIGFGAVGTAVRSSRRKRAFA